MMPKTPFKFDKSAVSIHTLGGESNDATFWLTKSLDERWAAMELMRQINYDYDLVVDQIPRVLDVAERA